MLPKTRTRSGLRTQLTMQDRWPAEPTRIRAQSMAFVLASPGGDLKDIGTLGGTNSEALAINKSGEVVGDAETSNGTPHAFLYRKNSTRDLGTLPGFDTASFARVHQ